MNAQGTNEQEECFETRASVSCTSGVWSQLKTSHRGGRILHSRRSVSQQYLPASPVLVLQ